MRTSVVLAAALALVLARAPAGLAAPPANDLFSNALVSPLPIADSVDIGQATTEPGEPQFCNYLPQTVWYAFTAATDGLVKANTASSSFYDTELNVYTANGSGLGGLSFVNCAAFGNPLTWTVRAGTTYYVQAGRVFGGPGTLTIAIDVVPPPPNDAFADAAPIGVVPFSGSADTTAATVEPGEPTPSCGYGQSAGTVWYAFTPATTGSYSVSMPWSGFSTQVAAYGGSSLASLTEIACRPFGQPLTFRAQAGQTYYLQAGGLFGSRGLLRLALDVAPDPVAQFWYSPGDPSSFDVVHFGDQSYDPGGVSVTARSWELGDGTTATGCCPTDTYADGDYTVRLTITTGDGRTASVTHALQVRTHDVAIEKLAVPQTASTDQTKTITVDLSNSRYPETVQVQLLKSSPAGFQQVGVLTQSVPVRNGGRTTDFKFSYTFTADDAAVGKVTFKAVATIAGARDALPADNEVTALSTSVNH